jgi:hypothetical protein
MASPVLVCLCYPPTTLARRIHLAFSTSGIFPPAASCSIWATMTSSVILPPVPSGATHGTRALLPFSPQITILHGSLLSMVSLISRPPLPRSIWVVHLHCFSKRLLERRRRRPKENLPSPSAKATDFFSRYGVTQVACLVHRGGPGNPDPLRMWLTP